MPPGRLTSSADWAGALAGPTNSAQARGEAPTSVRAQFGTDNTQNAVHGSDSDASAESEQ